MSRIPMTETKKPFVSVIMPIRNEYAFIEKAIASVLDNNYPAERMEVLVVDGMSNDGTRKIVEEVVGRDKRVKLLDNPAKIVPTAMNIGIQAARGEYVIRLDSHSAFSSDYISKCIEVAERTGAANVGGYIRTLPGAETRVAKSIAAASSSKFGVGNSAFRLTGPEQEADTVPFGTFRKELFEEIGGYDERLVRNQDIELNSRIRKAGGRIVISPEIQLSYYNRSTYTGLWQQAFNNGLWNPYTIWLLGSGLRLRHFVPMSFVLGLLVLSTGSMFWWPARWILLGYSLLYLSAASYFSVVRARETKALAFLILLSFVVLHIAYGLGSVWGIITIPFKFRGRRSRTAGTPLADRRM